MADKFRVADYVVIRRRQIAIIATATERGFTMNRTYQFRCRPTRAQSKWVDNSLRLVRDFYNAALQERRDAWQKCGKSIGFYDQDKSLTEIRRECPEYAALPQRICRSALNDLDLAFQAFFRRCKAGEKPGFPRFRSYRKPQQSLKFNEAVNWHKGEGKFGFVKVKGMPGKLRFKISNPAFLRDGVVRKTTTITRDHKGLLISFACSVPDVVPVITDGAVGIDVGIEKFYTDSDGGIVANPRLLDGAQKELRRRQRALSRKKRGSGNRERARMDVARLHAKVRNIRKTFHREVAARLIDKAVSENKFVAAEALNIKGLAKSKLARQIADVGWGDFLHSVESKSQSVGLELKLVDPKYTSQACSGCGEIVSKPLSQRVHNCPHCGLVIDRDHNAAINIRNRALEADAEAKVGVKTPALSL